MIKPWWYICSLLITVDDTGGQGWTPLMIAAQQGDIKVLKVLKKRTRTVFEPQQYCWTALHIAALHYQVWLVQRLFTMGFNVDDTDSRGVLHLWLLLCNGK